MRNSRRAFRIFIVCSIALAIYVSYSTFMRGQGEAWNRLTIPTSETLRSVHFVNASRGWAAGYNGTIIHTRDGGRTWTVQNSGTRERFLSIRFVDENTGWALAGAYVARTVDAGQTWVNARVDASALKFRNVIFPPSTTVPWAAVNSTAGASTRWFSRYTVQSDGTIREEDFNVIGSTAQYSDLHFVDANNGWAVGSGPVVRISNASGSSPAFSFQTVPVPDRLWAIQMLDANNGWIVGSGGTILKTTNGGSSWVRVTSGTQTALRDVHFVDSQTGWVVGENGLILSPKMAVIRGDNKPAAFPRRFSASGS